MIWDVNDDLRHIKNMEVFLDSECAYCRSEECFDPDCKYKEILNLANTALDHPDNHNYLLDALKEIKLLTEFLIGSK